MKNNIILDLLPIKTERLIIKKLSLEDVDLLLKTDKQEIISWGMPDYSAGVDIKTTLQNNKSYTAPTKGVLFNSMIPTNKTEIKINGYSVGIRQYSTYGNYIPTPYYLNAGDVFSVTSWADSNGSAYFFPLKGAK
jgi:hypothetical protein